MEDSILWDGVATCFRIEISGEILGVNPAT